jgi:ATP-binding cassette subfamily B (MDR/TAP) protein 1
MHRLFAFADRRDAVLMTVGAAAAMANGIAMPFLAFLVGDLVDAFGPAHRANVVHAVAKVRAV